MNCASCGEITGHDRTVFRWWVKGLRHEAYFHRGCFDSEKKFPNFYKYVLTFEE